MSSDRYRKGSEGRERAIKAASRQGPLHQTLLHHLLVPIRRSQPILTPWAGGEGDHSTCVDADSSAGGPTLAPGEG
jgi:hypothetical protein